MKAYKRSDIEEMRRQTIQQIEGFSFETLSLPNYWYWQGKLQALSLLSQDDHDVINHVIIEDLRIEAATAMNEAKKRFDKIREKGPMGVLLAQGLHLHLLMGAVYTLDEMRGEYGQDILMLLKEIDGL